MQYSPDSNAAHPDHEALRRSASDLRCLLSREPSAEPSSAGRCLVDSLDEFSRHVNRHFDVEEHEWSETGELDWTSRARIDALKREHDGLRTRLGAISSALGEVRNHGGAFPLALVAEIRGVLDELLRHELSEAGLLQSQVLSECPRPRWEGSPRR